MSTIERARHKWRTWRNRRSRRHPGPTVWHHDEYRVAIEGLGLETKRADLALWALIDHAIIAAEDVQRPTRIGYGDLAAVHSAAVLEGLSSAEALAPVFGAHPSELPVESVATTIRLACGATLAAAKRATSGAGPQVNLLGGFHHASPAKGGGFSVVNDIAVAIRALRREGLEGRVGVLDLDAHPPDGTADCANAPESTLGEVWIGSISGTDWGALAGVDETVITGADDRMYLETLDALLTRMPRCALVFILAGGDVLKGDRFGGLALSLEGARDRDMRVARHLERTPSVWLSAGGYSDDAWRVLFNTVSAIALRRPAELPADYQPLRARYARLARELEPPRDQESFLSYEDLAQALGMPFQGEFRLLDTYSAEWIEYAFHRYGVLQHIRRLGYSDFRVQLEQLDDGDRLRLFGHAGGAEHLLVEVVADRVRRSDLDYLFVNWLTLRHPIAKFTPARPRLPNQEVPGLGLAQEAGELLAVMAGRLGLVGVAIRPAAFHVAFAAKADFSFADAARQGRFEKLLSDLGDTPLTQLTDAIDAGQVTLDGHPYVWEATLMVMRLDGSRVPAEPCDGVFEFPSRYGIEEG